MLVKLTDTMLDTDMINYIIEDGSGIHIYTKDYVKIGITREELELINRILNK